MGHASTHRLSMRARVAIVVGVSIACVSVAAVVAHKTALSLEQVARDTTVATSARTEAAQRAIDFDPFSQRFRVTYAIAKARQLTEEGYADEAYFLLLPLASTVTSDALFRETYQDVVGAKAPGDARKAHQQHAKETTAGGLAPEDVFK